ncbi:MAG TPA: hypothetical protein GX698_03155, partial [Acholeplasmataceae bacterium]|nr:hypothetical protein [Acholeplasmataceae bacterium]
MKKLKYLIKYGLKKRIFTKAFYISTAIIGIIIVGITLLPTIIGLFSGEPGGEVVDDQILIVDTTGYNFNGALSDGLHATVDALYDDQLQADLSTNAADVPGLSYYDQEDPIYRGIIYIYLEGDLVKAEVYNRGMHGMITSFLTELLPELQRMKYQVDHSVPGELIADTQYEFVKDPNAEDTELQAIMSALSTAVIIPIFILITMSLQFIGTEIMEEKSTKAIEIIIASVPPRTHF